MTWATASLLPTPASSPVSPETQGTTKGKKNKTPPSWWEERLKSAILEEAYRNVKIRDNNKLVSIPMANAVVRAVGLNAAKGNNRAAALFTQIVKVVEDENRAKHEEWMDVALNYKIEWEKEFRRLERTGQPLPVLYPDPRDIAIDSKRGTVIVNGPMTKEDEEMIQLAKERLRECKQSIASYREDLASETD